jgi:hypothetical protein
MKTAEDYDVEMTGKPLRVYSQPPTRQISFAALKRCCAFVSEGRFCTNEDHPVFKKSFGWPENLKCCEKECPIFNNLPQ